MEKLRSWEGFEGRELRGWCGDGEEARKEGRKELGNCLWEGGYGSLAIQGHCERRTSHFGRGALDAAPSKVSRNGLMGLLGTGGFEGWGIFRQRGSWNWGFEEGTLDYFTVIPVKQPSLTLFD